jgi:hypothetical protein
MGAIQVNAFTVEDMLKALASQEWAVPLFQREFVWSTRDVCLLADSILKGRPIGIATLWKITDEMASDLGTESVSLGYGGKQISFSTRREAGQQLAILDGRQRCTAIAMAFGGLRVDAAKSQYNGRFFLQLDAEPDDEWVIFLKEKDIAKHGFDTVSTCLANGYLPLEVPADGEGNRKIGSDWMNQVAELLRVKEIFPKNEIPMSEVIDRRLSRLNAATDGINKTRLATYELGPEFALSDICEIFETLNQTGIRVSTADLLHTILFQQTANHLDRFNLRAWLDDLGQVTGARGWSSSTDKPERIAQFATTTYIAQVEKPRSTGTALSKSQQKINSIKAKDILATPSEHWLAIRDNQDQFVSAMTNFQQAVAGGFFPASKCPYPAMAAIYVGLHWSKAIENNPSDNMWSLDDLRVLFRAYFWRSALSQRFDQGMLSKVTADMAELRLILRAKEAHETPISWYNWASNELDKLIKPEDVPTSAQIRNWVLDGEVKGARSQAVRLLPLTGSRYDIVKHQEIDVTSEGNSQLHHIWPKSWISKNLAGDVKAYVEEADAEREDRINSAANMTPLTADSNNWWKDKKPSQALTEMKAEFDDAKDIYESAYINESAFKELANGEDTSFRQFLEIRADLISEAIVKRLGLYPGA